MARLPLAVLTALFAAAAPVLGEQACLGGISKGAIGVKGPASSTMYVVGEGGSVSGDRLTVKHNSGFSLFDTCEHEWKPESIAQFKLLGKMISFTVDLKHVGCACNLAFYLISMPAHDIHGEYNKGTDRGGQPPYYCDANMVGGQWCPEIDIMEANDHAFQATPHNCESPENGHYSYCDRAGCSQNTRTVDGSYGPGERYQIDTTRPFEVSTEFFEKGGAFAVMRTTLRQAARKVVLDHKTCDERYLAKLSGAMTDGMSVRITYWGKKANTMSWLDAPPCGSQVCEGGHAGDAAISNITVSELAHDSSPPEEGGAADVPAAPQTWVSDTWQSWKCHHYFGNQQESDWCANAGFEDGYEYKYTGGLGNLCGVCWCCKRKAKLAAATDAPAQTTSKQWWTPPSSTTAAPAGQPAPAPAGQPTKSTTKAPTTTPKPAPLEKGPITIKGMDNTYLAGQGGSVDGDKITIHHNSGFSIFDAKATQWEPQNIAEFKLLGKTISFSVDLSKVGCACNLAFYLISMPARDPQGNPSRGSNRGGQPPFYCDANKVGGQWCPEIDIMEANNHAFQATLHRCDAARHRHYGFCDRGGCAQNTRERQGAYGPGSEHTIDTMRPFDVDTEFLASGGKLTGMRTTLRQRGQRVVLEHAACNEGYLAKLTEAMKFGMSLRITYWGDAAQTMAWMDVPPCDYGECSGANAGDAIISEMKVMGALSEGPLAWVVSDPKDELFGQVVPRDVSEGSDNFAVLNDQGVAKWDHVKHFVKKMPTSEIEAMVLKWKAKDEREAEKESSQEANYLNTLIARYSASAAKAKAAEAPGAAAAEEGARPAAQAAVMVFAVLLVVAGVALVVRRVGPLAPPRKPSGASPGGSYAGGVFARAATASPGQSPGSAARGGRSPGQGLEGPSPVRRATRASMMTSPGNGRQELLSMMESCIE